MTFLIINLSKHVLNEIFFYYQNKSNPTNIFLNRVIIFCDKSNLNCGAVIQNRMGQNEAEIPGGSGKPLQN